MNIILSNLTLKNQNKGCVALCISTMYLIHKVLEERDIKYKLYITDSGYQSNGMHELEIDGTKIEFYSCGYYDWSNLKPALKQLYLFFFKQEEYRINREVFNNVDFILDIGQGDSFADIYGKGRFDWIDRIHRIARKKNVPYCILPQTIGPFKNEETKKQAIQSINKAKFVMARDAQSLLFVQENCPGKKASEYIDVAFFMPYKKQNFSKDFIHVGLNVSGLLWHGGYTRNNQFELKVDYQKLIINIIEYFLTFPNVKIHIVPHVVDAESNIENDYEISYHLVNEYSSDRVVLAPLFLSPIYAKNYIAGMDFFLGARMHATIAAFSTGVPVFPMAYSRKFNGLFMDTLNYEAMGDMKSEGNDVMIKKIIDAFTNRAFLKEIITNRLETTVYEKGELLKKDIASFFSLK